MNGNYTWDQIKLKLREDIVVLPHFLKNPVAGMRNLPQWEWPTILILQGAFAAFCAVVANFIERNYLGVFTGLIVGPLANFLIAGIATGFFHFYFLYVFKKEIRYHLIYLNVIFAAIPLMICAMVAFLVPPLILVGIFASMLLVFVGFVNNFGIPAKHLRNLLGVIFAVLCLSWGYQQITSTHKHKSSHNTATPESLDILEKELNNE